MTMTRRCLPMAHYHAQLSPMVKLKVYLRDRLSFGRRMPTAIESSLTSWLHNLFRALKRLWQRADGMHVLSAHLSALSSVVRKRRTSGMSEIPTDHFASMVFRGVRQWFWHFASMVLGASSENTIPGKIGNSDFVRASVTKNGNLSPI